MRVFQKTNLTNSLLPPACHRLVYIAGTAECSARKLKIFKIARNLKILASIKNYFRCLYKKLIFGRNGAIYRKIIPLVWAVNTAAIATTKWLRNRHFNRPDFNRRKFCAYVLPRISSFRSSGNRYKKIISGQIFKNRLFSEIICLNLFKNRKIGSI